MLAAIVALAMVLPATEKNEEFDLLLKRALEIWRLQGRPVLKAGSAERCLGWRSACSCIISESEDNGTGKAGFVKEQWALGR